MQNVTEQLRVENDWTADASESSVHWRPCLTLWLIFWFLTAGILLGQSWSDRKSTPTKAKETPSAASANRTFASKAIKDIRTGMRVIADNPELNGQDSHQAAINPETWRNIQLRMIKPQGGELLITLLRPLEWIESRNYKGDREINLQLEELGVMGSAQILSVDPCPLIEKGQGRVVTGTFSHSAANVIDLLISGEDEPIGTTANHRFWSETRRCFVSAELLGTGEAVKTISGRIAFVKSHVTRAGPHPVFNLEVESEHVYCITESGILVHNEYVKHKGPVYHGTDNMSAAQIQTKGLNKEDWHIAAGGAGVDPKGFSVTTKREVAEAWAQIRAADRDGQAVVLEADGSALPLREGSLDDLVDPDELFIRPRDFSAVGPGLFKPVQ